MKSLVSLLCLMICISCVHHKWTDITNLVVVEDILQEYFPKLHKRYQIGEIVVTKISALEEDGSMRYQVTYKDKTDESDEEFLLWQTVYAPTLQ